MISGDRGGHGVRFSDKEALKGRASQIYAAFCTVANRRGNRRDPKWQMPIAMEGITPTVEPRAVLLWRNEAVICTCLTHAADNIEIRLVVVGAVVHRQFFADAEAASEFAIDKMHVYNASS